jgi:hypothetical protein
MHGCISRPSLDARLALGNSPRVSCAPSDNVTVESRHYCVIYERSYADYPASDGRYAAMGNKAQIPPV